MYFILRKGGVKLDLDNDTIKRLVFIKYMYEKAVEFSHGPQPMSQMSVMMFHDAIELFLYLSYEKCGGTKTPDKISFMSYWDEIKGKLKKNLTQKISIGKLDRTRAGLKHHGILVSESMIEGFRVSATNFFEENSQIVFDIDFTELSLIDLIEFEDVKESLEKAKNQLKEGKIEEANKNIGIGFFLLMENVKRISSEKYGNANLGLFSHSIRFPESILSNSVKEDIKRSFEMLQESMKIIVLGIDYNKYSNFLITTPTARKSMGGKIITNDRKKANSSINTKNSKIEMRLTYNPVESTKEEVIFGIDFVIESSIAVQEYFSM